MLRYLIPYMLLLYVLTTYTGCTSFAEKQTNTDIPLYNYKADISIIIKEKNKDDLKFDGMAVLDLQPTQEIKIISKAKLDVLIVSSCQRFETYEKLDKDWFGGAGKEFKYTYTPSKTESEEKCPLYFQALDKSGLTAWGYVAFKTTETLVAQVECNGKSFQSNGVTLCQTKKGFEQVMSFATPVKYKAEDTCVVTQINDRAFKIIPDVSFCNIVFSDVNGISKHKATILGYEKAFIRGE